MNQRFRPIIEKYESLYKKIGEGRNRVVFETENGTVIKVPKNGYGVLNNFNEAKIYEKFGLTNGTFFFAACKIIECNANIPILEMEKVFIIKDTDSQVPNWARYIDCTQIGLNSNGIIVAFDYGEENL